MVTAMNRDDVLTDEQRAEILDAAYVCFEMHGYEGTSIEAIAARSGLPTSVVSQHFADKTEIRSALLALWSERLSAWMTNG